MVRQVDAARARARTTKRQNENEQMLDASNIFAGSRHTSGSIVVI